MTVDRPKHMQGAALWPPARPGAEARSRITYLGATILIVGALTALRLAGLRFSVVDLFYDEAQYWSWSRDLAFGYYSKPPLLAWVIAAAERICGSDEWCVRTPAPIFYFATSLVVYAIGETLYDERAGFWAALLTAFGTGTAFSSRIISTDVPLLFFWAVALLAYVKLLTGASRGWALVLGIAIGLGLLAKYAMIYFVPGLLLAALLSERARTALAKPDIWIALAIGALVVAPNIAWNVTNGFVTFKHTGSLVLGEETRLSLLHGLEFLAAQFAVFGPVVFAVMILATLRITALDIIEQDRILIAFALPPLVIVTAFAVAVHAYANWAAAAFVSGAVLTAAVLSRRNPRFWLIASIVLGLAVQCLLLYADAIATRVSLPFLTSSNPYHRTLGWRAYAEAAGQLARRLGAPTIASDSRGELAALLYYWRDRPEQILSWRTADIPHFDLAQPLTPAAREPILFVTWCPDIERIRPFYAQIEPLGEFRTPIGANGARGFHAFKLSGNRGTVGVLPECGRTG